LATPFPGATSISAILRILRRREGSADHRHHAGAEGVRKGLPGFDDQGEIGGERGRLGGRISIPEGSIFGSSLGTFRDVC
jgi:hypothetical protein